MARAATATTRSAELVSAFSHAVIALAFRAPFPKAALPRGAALAGIAMSILPDADVIGFRFGVEYGDFWGHRGFTHSLVFAAGAAALATALWSRAAQRPFSRRALWLYLFLCTGSHGLFDAMTSGGLGIAFFSPFDTARYFLPWTPVLVSPIGIENFFNERGLAVIRSELVWVWAPVIALSIAATLLRRRVAAGA